MLTKNTAHDTISSSFPAINSKEAFVQGIRFENLVSYMQCTARFHASREWNGNGKHYIHYKPWIPKRFIVLENSTPIIVSAMSMFVMKDHETALFHKNVS